MSTFEVAGMSPMLKTVMDTATQFLGASGSGEITIKPDNAPKPLVSVPVGSGASVQLPATLDLKYTKSGDQLTVVFNPAPSAIYKGISVPVTKVVADLKQVQISLGGMIGMFTSITLKATP